MDDYSHAERGALREDIHQLVAQNARLKQRNAQLEQLVKDFNVFVSRREVAGDEIREAVKKSLQERAKALLEQEVK